MIDSNLIKTMKTFSGREMKEFREFVNSPCYNTNPNVTKLFNLLKKYYPDFKSKNLEKEKLFNKVYKGEKYKDSKMRLLIFYLNEVSEKFLVHKNMSRDDLTYDVSLLNELSKRNLDSSFEKTMNITYKKLNDTKVKDSNYLINKFYTDLQNISYFRDSPNYKYDDNKSKDNPEEIFLNLTNYYLLMAFELYSTLLTASHLYKHSFKFIAFEKIIDGFDKAEYSAYPEILCRYYMCMLCSKPDDETNYYELKKLVDTNKKIISPSAFRASFIGLNNFCVSNIRTGKRKFQAELFELYKENLENKFYREDGCMPHMFYRNAVSVGADLKEFDWAANFIEKYKNELQKEIREPMYLYCLAYLEIEQKNYERALKYLSIIKTDEIYLKVAVRVLQCRLFFELGWREQVSSLVDSTRHFMANDKILPAAQKDFYLGYFKFINKLTLAKASGNMNKLETLKKEIEKEENVHAKDWLLNKIKENENQNEALSPL